MYLQSYFWFLGPILLCMLFAMAASGKVRSTYAKYDQVRTRSGLTGYMAAARLMQAKGVQGISLGTVPGELTDHYHPAKAVVNLSQATSSSASVAAVAVAAHEIGHVLQKQQGHLFYRFRTALVPVVNFGTRLAMPLVLVGLLLDGFSRAASSGTGFYIAMVGVVLYGGSLLFALVTLPVELDASRRASSMLLETGVLTREELPGAKKVLSAAAMTYLAAVLTSLVYFLRFLAQVLFLFGRRSNR